MQLFQTLAAAGMADVPRALLCIREVNITCQGTLTSQERSA